MGKRLKYKYERTVYVYRSSRTRSLVLHYIIMLMEESFLVVYKVCETACLAPFHFEDRVVTYLRFTHVYSCSLACIHVLDERYT